MRECLVSIVIPVYNVKHYLCQCLDSVIRQTYRCLQIILIDDGSTDGSGEICDHYGRIDNRITVFHTKNRGLSAARNIGLDNILGDYIMFVDSDDWLEINAIEKTIGIINNYKSEVVSFNYAREFVDKTKPVKVCKADGPQLYYGDEIVEAICNKTIGLAAWNKIYIKGIVLGC